MFRCNAYEAAQVVYEVLAVPPELRIANKLSHKTGFGKDESMTDQEKKAQLCKYCEAQAMADRLREEIVRLYSKAERMTTVLKLVTAGGGDDRKIESAIEGIDEIAGRLGEKQSEANRVRRRIEDAISTVSDGRLRLLLEYKYIDGMTWEEVADKMDLSVRGTTKMHSRALAEVQISSL